MKTAHYCVLSGIGVVSLIVSFVCFSCEGPSGASEQKARQLTVDLMPQFFSGSIFFSEAASAHSDLELYEDSTFLLLRRINNDTIWNGVFGRWKNDSSGMIVLDGGTQAQLNLKLMESALLILNSEGEQVEDSEQFMLHQLSDSSMIGRRFVVEGEYFYMADAVVMRFCATGKKAWPVALSGDNLQAEKFYLIESSSRPEQKVFINAEISVFMDTGMEGDPRPHIMIHKFLGGAWKSDCL